MSNVDQDSLCRRCDRPVKVYRDQYVFEGMHYVCFHYEFEHDPSDPDEPCNDPGCPSAPASRQRDRVISTIRELLADWSAGTPAHWENQTVPNYLEALAAWLHDSDGYYTNRRQVAPWNGWQVMVDALPAAAFYE